MEPGNQAVCKTDTTGATPVGLSNFKSHPVHDRVGKWSKPAGFLPAIQGFESPRGCHFPSPRQDRKHLRNLT